MSHRGRVVGKQEVIRFLPVCPSPAQNVALTSAQVELWERSHLLYCGRPILQKQRLPGGARP